MRACMIGVLVAATVVGLPIFADEVKNDPGSTTQPALAQSVNAQPGNGEPASVQPAAGRADNSQVVVAAVAAGETGPGAPSPWNTVAGSAIAPKTLAEPGVKESKAAS